MSQTSGTRCETSENAPSKRRRGHPDTDRKTPPRYSQREREALKCAALGGSLESIASMLGCTVEIADEWLRDPSAMLGKFG